MPPVGAEALEGADRAGAALLLKQALAAGRAEIARRLEERPYAGTEIAAAYAFLTDQIVRLAYDYATRHLHPLANPTTSERLLLLGVLPEARRIGLYPLLMTESYRRAGARGYRRGEMSWTLEDNHAVNAGIEAIGGRRSKTYRLYEKAFG